MAERTVLVRLRATSADYVREMVKATIATKSLLAAVDQTNDRTAWLAQSLLALGPALVPIGAAMVPVISGLATQMTITAAAAGVTALAFNGVGDSLEALNEYQLDPTLDNLLAMQHEFAKLGPAGTEFVHFLDSLGPQLETLQLVAGEGMFGGMQAGIDDMMTMLPRVRGIVYDLAEGMGELAQEAGEGFSSDRFEVFFTYLEQKARPLLEDMGHTLGNLIDGLAAMMVAFDPLTQRFSKGFLQMSRDFAGWAHGLQEDQSFLEFVSYVNASIPKVLALLGSLTDAFVALVRALAPIGDVMLPALSTFLDVVGAVMSTPLGTMFLGLAAATSAYGRAMALASITTGGMLTRVAPVGVAIAQNTGATLRAIPPLNAWTTAMFRAGQAAHYQTAQTKGAIAGVKGFVGGLGPAAASIGMFALILSDVDDSAGLANTAMLTMAGTMVGGPWGAAMGAGVGLTMDLAAANDDLEDAIVAASEALEARSIPAMQTAQEHLETLLADLETYSTTDLSTPFGDIPGGLGFYDLVSDKVSELNGTADEAREKVGELNDELARDPADNFITGPFIESLQQAQQEADALRQSLLNVNAVLDARATWRDYQAALDDFWKGLREGKKTLDAHLRAGRLNAANLDEIAASALEVAANFQSMDERSQFLEAVRDKFIRAARAAGMGKVEARELATELGLVGQVDPDIDVKDNLIEVRKRGEDVFNLLDEIGASDPVATVTAQTAAAMSALDAVMARINAITGVFGVTINAKVNTTTSSTPAPPSGGRPVDDAPARTTPTAPRLSQRNVYGDGVPVPAVSAAGGGGGGGGGVLEIVGTLDTPFGPSEIRGIARAAVADAREADTRTAYVGRR